MVMNNYFITSVLFSHIAYKTVADMKSSVFFCRNFKIVLFALLLCNFGAFAQKTTIWIVSHAENVKDRDMLSDSGQERANDLMKALRHSGVETIYTTGARVSQQTANPLAVKVRLLPRIYTDSIKKFAGIIKTNFIGKNVLIIADYKTIIPLLGEFGADSPFDELGPGDYDQLFTVTIKPSGDAESAVRYFGKKHHDNEIPQSYIMDNFQPGVPGK
jgi:2,3-bisphosphoglycerate-dependent phosphoglycerate mutase